MSAAIFALASPSPAYVITINPGTKALYLQVGVGTYTGGNHNSGGTPGNNATINRVSLSVPASSLGNGTAQAMTSDSTAAQSFIDGFTFCTPPAQVYVGGWARQPSNGGTAMLTVTTPANLSNGSGTIPFSQISWVSSGIGDTALAIPSGTFTGGTQTLAAIQANSWAEQCMTFSYQNAAVPPAGTYSGRAVYTLTMP